MKTIWYKTRWVAAGLAGIVGLGPGSGMGEHKQQPAAVPGVQTTVSVTPAPIVETVTVAATATAVETIETTATATETIPAETMPSTDAPTTVSPSESTPTAKETMQQSEVYYKSCAEAKAAGVAPMRKGEPGYRPELDRDKDGVACDK